MYDMSPPSASLQGFYLFLELAVDMLLVGQLCQEVGPAWECLSADDKGS